MCLEQGVPAVLCRLNYMVAEEEVMHPVPEQAPCNILLFIQNLRDWEFVRELFHESCSNALLSFFEVLLEL